MLAHKEQHEAEQQLIHLTEKQMMLHEVLKAVMAPRVKKNTLHHLLQQLCENAIEIHNITKGMS